MPSDATPARRIEELRMRCAAVGKPLTPQRRAVMEALASCDDHPTADAIHTVVARKLPGISRATVYRTLETFVELGLASRVSHPGVAVRFDPRTDRHHHFHCERCGAITDVEPSSDLPAPLPPSLPGRVRIVSVLFKGECRDCSERALVGDALHRGRNA